MTPKTLALTLAGVLFVTPLWAQNNAALATSTPTESRAPSADAPYLALQQQWEQAKYNTPEAEREKALEALSNKAKAVMAEHPKDASTLIWSAIVLSSYAGEKGGLGALSLVKEAKVLLEQAIEVDPNALNGSAYTSLGSLYYQVPGWPVGFGDSDTAREMLDKALATAPDSIDANYFYGDFLLSEEDYAGAIEKFEKALQAAPRPGRELADSGRRQEIEMALAKARAEL